MNFEWDERKRLSNLEKHGLDFIDIFELFENPCVVVPSSHSSEELFLAIGLIQGRHVTTVYTLRGENMKSYSSDELKAMKGQSLSDWNKVDAMTDKELEQHLAEDDEGFSPDWTRAELVLPEAKQSVHLRIEREVIEFFKADGKGHLVRMQAVLKAYADAHRRPE